MKTITCPHCGFSREIPAERIPVDAVTVTCPQCAGTFTLGEDVESPAGPAAVASEKGAESIAGEDVGSAAELGLEQTRKLLELGELFGRTWELYKRRVGSLLLLGLVTMLMVVCPILLMMGVGFLAGLAVPGMEQAFLVGGGVTGAVVGIFTSVWGGAAFFRAIVDERCEIRDALAGGSRLYVPFLWLFILSGFIKTGGFLLLIIPGIVFSVAFTFAPYIVAEEKGKGMDALMLSMEYVRQHWVDVFIRLLLLWLLGAVVGSIPLVGPVLSLLYIPFEYLFVFLLYRNMVDIRGELVPSASSATRFLVVALSVIGWIVIPGLLVFFIGLAVVQNLLG